MTGGGREERWHPCEGTRRHASKARQDSRCRRGMRLLSEARMVLAVAVPYLAHPGGRIGPPPCAVKARVCFCGRGTDGASPDRFGACPCFSHGRGDLVCISVVLRRRSPPPVDSNSRAHGGTRMEHLSDRPGWAAVAKLYHNGRPAA